MVIPCIDSDDHNKRNVTLRKDNTAQRVTSLGYDASAEETRKGYTGYEKDGESGLDFAQARYYNAVHGRFTSVDPLTASASIRIKKYIEGTVKSFLVGSPIFRRSKALTLFLEEQMNLSKLVVFVGIAGIIVAIFAFVYFKPNYITDIVIADNVSVGSEWSTITLQSPIEIRKAVNKLNLDPAPPFEFGPTHNKVVGPDGKEFLPEVEIVLDTGEIIPIPYAGGRFTTKHNFVSYGRLSTLRAGMVVREVRLRSEHDLPVRTIWWSSYNAKDMP